MASNLTIDQASVELQELFSDINETWNRNHARIIELVKIFPSLAVVPLIPSRKLDEKNEHNTVLTRLLYEWAPLSVIRQVVEASPESVRAKEGPGDLLPLHTACLYYKKNYESSDVIIYLIEQYAESVFEKYPQGEKAFPIHKLAEGNANVLVAIKYMVKKYPQVVSLSDNSGRLPLHYACRPPSSSPGDPMIIEFLARSFPQGLKAMSHVTLSPNSDFANGTPLHFLLANEKQSPKHRTLKLFVELFPECVTVKDSLGNLPLTIACCAPRRRRHNLDALRFLAWAYPEALKVSDCDGRIPIHGIIDRQAPLWLIKEWVEMYPDSLNIKTARTYNGGTPLRSACCGQNNPGVVKYLAQQNPVVIKEKSYLGQNILHCLIQFSSRSSRVNFIDKFKALTDLCPEALEIKDDTGRLPLHLACEFALSEAIAYLCQYYPESTKKAAAVPIGARGYPKGARGSIPLHLLLQEQTYRPKLQDVERLVNIYPEGIWEGIRPGINALTYACTGNFFDYCARKLPKTESSLVLGGEGFPFLFSNDKAVTIGGLMPQLEFFHCFPNYFYDFNGEGWFHMVGCLQGNPSIVDLALTVPALLLASLHAANDNFRQIILRSSVRKLKLRLVDSDQKTMEKVSEPKPRWNVGNFVVDMLREAKLSALVVESGSGELNISESCASKIIDFLKDNTTLRILSLPSLELTSVQLNRLFKILKLHNSTLEHLDIRNPISDHRMEKIQYYARLNQCGRSKLRIPTATAAVLVELLSPREVDSIKRSTSLLGGQTRPTSELSGNGDRSFRNEMDRLNVIYGLLRETPSVWCSAS